MTGEGVLLLSAVNDLTATNLKTFCQKFQSEYLDEQAFKTGLPVL